MDLIIIRSIPKFQPEIIIVASQNGLNVPVAAHSRCSDRSISAKKILHYSHVDCETVAPNSSQGAAKRLISNTVLLPFSMLCDMVLLMLLHSKLLCINFRFALNRLGDDAANNERK